MLEYAIDVMTVVVGIAVYKKLDNLYDDLVWKWKQRHSSSDDPWDSW